MQFTNKQVRILLKEELKKQAKEIFKFIELFKDGSTVVIDGDELEKIKRKFI